MDIMKILFRWIHVVAGIVWIGHLYFFNWVNSAFAPTMDAETKKKVVPELMPRALYWFRWGAAWTWVTGLLLLGIVFWHGGLMLEGGAGWSAPAIVMVLVVFAAPFVYDAIMKSLGKGNMKAAIAVCFVLVVLDVLAMVRWAHFGYRGYVIHTGSMFGTIMAYNVWFRIWPSQKQIITAVKGGAAPDAALVALAGTRSRHNTYMSVPLVWAMLDEHSSTISPFNSERWGWLILGAVILFAWWITSMLYRRAPKVKGF